MNKRKNKNKKVIPNTTIFHKELTLKKKKIGCCWTGKIKEYQEKGNARKALDIVVRLRKQEPAT